MQRRALISARFTQRDKKKKANRLADGIHGCENKLVTLKVLLPLTQESHQATVTFFSLPLLHGAWEHSPGSATGIQILPCFNYCTTNQPRRTVWFVYWQLLLLYLHRANLLLVPVGSFKKGQTRDYRSEIIGFFLWAQSLGRGHPHSRSWG